MRILLVADEESRYYWDHFQRGRLDDIDLIISCGDLKPEYLTFLVTMGKAPLLYVHGNHDTNYTSRPPEGCFCIEDRIILVNGLRIMGLGGCPTYSGGPHQYTERQMRKRIRKMRFQLWFHRGVDIVVTHAPVKGYGDGPDYAHRGFGAFLPLLEKHKPKYLFHGHVHLRYGADVIREHQCGETTLINGCDRYILELPEYIVNKYVVVDESENLLKRR